jgi:hypothetical protein
VWQAAHKQEAQDMVVVLHLAWSAALHIFHGDSTAFSYQTAIEYYVVFILQ